MKVTKKEIRPIVMATFPDYKGRKFTVHACSHMKLWDLNWSGGTRNVYIAVQRKGMATCRVVPQAPWMETREGVAFALPTNAVVVRHTHFCGKDLGITVYVHPSMMPQLLPERVGREVNAVT